jgi:hypothetical protein
MHRGQEVASGTSHHTTSAARATRPNKHVSLDLHGPMQTASHKSHLYWLTFVCQFSGLTTVYFIHQKSEAFDCFKKWLAWAERQNGNKVVHFRDDKGGEYISEEMNEYMAERGIKREHTIRDSPQQNGQAERYNQTMQQAITLMLAKSRLPQSLWVDAAATFIHLNNQIPSESRGFKSPYELYYSNVPSITHLCTFGCLACVHLQKDQRQGSFGPHAKRCIFLWYADEVKGWVFWDTEKRAEITSDSAIFVENIFPGSLTGKIPLISDGILDTLPAPPVAPDATLIPLPPSPGPSHPLSPQMQAPTDQPVQADEQPPPANDNPPDDTPDDNQSPISGVFFG